MVETGLTLALFILVFVIALTSYRVLRGPHAADRLQAIDAWTTLLIAVIVVGSVILEESALMDIAMALALFSFVGTLAIARFLRQEEVF